MPMSHPCRISVWVSECVWSHRMDPTMSTILVIPRHIRSVHTHTNVCTYTTLTNDSWIEIFVYPIHPPGGKRRWTSALLLDSKTDVKTSKPCQSTCRATKKHNITPLENYPPGASSLIMFFHDQAGWRRELKNIFDRCSPSWLMWRTGTTQVKDFSTIFVIVFLLLCVFVKFIRVSIAARV